MCQSRSTLFPRILFFVICGPRDMQEYIFMFKHVNVCRNNIEGYGLYMYYGMHLKYCQNTGIYRSIENLLQQVT